MSKKKAQKALAPIESMKQMELLRSMNMGKSPLQWYKI